MGNREPFADGEWYHCFSRGIDRRTVYSSVSDFHRFTELLYLCNSNQSVRRDDMPKVVHEDVFQLPKASPLVSIGAFVLMPNHFHIVLTQTNEMGISRFMQKLMTGYTMYYNIRYKRSGSLFTRPFRSVHIGDDRYLQYVVDYVHLNPVEYSRGNPERLVTDAMHYRHSSFGLHMKIRRTELPILGPEIFEVYQKKSPKLMLESVEVYRTP